MWLPMTFVWVLMTTFGWIWIWMHVIILHSGYRLYMNISKFLPTPAISSRPATGHKDILSPHGFVRHLLSVMQLAAGGMCFLGPVCSSWVTINRHLLQQQGGPVWKSHYFIVSCGRPPNINQQIGRIAIQYHELHPWSLITCSPQLRIYIRKIQRTADGKEDRPIPWFWFAIMPTLKYQTKQPKGVAYIGMRTIIIYQNHACTYKTSLYYDVGFNWNHMYN